MASISGSEQKECRADQAEAGRTKAAIFPSMVPRGNFGHPTNRPCPVRPRKITSFLSRGQGPARASRVGGPLHLDRRGNRQDLLGHLVVVTRGDANGGPACVRPRPQGRARKQAARSRWTSYAILASTRGDSDRPYRAKKPDADGGPGKSRTPRSASRCRPGGRVLLAAVVSVVCETSSSRLSGLCTSTPIVPRQAGQHSETRYPPRSPPPPFRGPARGTPLCRRHRQQFVGL